MIFPDGFNGLEPISWRENFTRVTYFSFVTLTTLGYGDISPKNSITQFFVYTEAIVGVFYMATFVSSIVSARLNHHNTKKS
jgi:voltage-gated potassium channel Kch